MQSQTPSLGLLPDSEVQKIDEKLSSGCYVCYNWWLYVMGIVAFFSFLYSVRQVFTSSIFIVDVLRNFIEGGFAYTMLDVFRQKKLNDAVAGWVSALVCSLLMAFVIGVQASSLIRHFGSGPFAVGASAIVLYYCLAYLLPAWKIKALIEKREEAIITTNKYSA